MKTASNANLGMAIGVLTGVATKEELHRSRCNFKQCERYFRSFKLKERHSVYVN